MLANIIIISFYEFGSTNNAVTQLLPTNKLFLYAKSLHNNFVNEKGSES